MVLIFAATIGKIIYDEVKDHKEKGGHHNHGHKRSTSISSQKGRPSMDKPLPLTPPQLEMHRRESLSPLSPRSSLSISPIEGRYEMDVPPPPPYRAYRPPVVPAKEPLMVKVGNDMVPWSPDDIRMPVEGSLEEDLRRPDAKLEAFELDEGHRRLKVETNFFELE